ncbi:MAG: two-component regulator propeller domain-containing protein [Planctomycetota bacterium]
MSLSLVASIWVPSIDREDQDGTRSPPAQRTLDPGGQVVDEVDPRVWCLYEDQDGALWFGSNGAGVFRRRGDELIQYTAEHGLTGDQVRHITGDGTDGVLRYDGSSVTQHSLPEGAYAISILIDRSGMAWVGTLEHGALRLRGGEFR